MLKRNISFFLATLFLTLLSCSDNADEKREKAKVAARGFLTRGECDKALQALEDAGNKDSDGRYLQLKASAYACRAGYPGTPTILVTDIPKFDVDNLWGSLTTFTNADEMTDYEDFNFVQMQNAIDTLLYAGGIPLSREPTATERAQFLDEDEANDINAQLLYFLFWQIGQYLHYYGDSSSTGVKGSGTGSNECLLSYTNIDMNLLGDMDTVLNAQGSDSCDPGDEGRPDMGGAGTPNVERACQGIVLINNWLTIVPAVLSDIAGDDFTGVDTALLTVAKTALLTSAPATDSTNLELLSSTLSQSRCEEYAGENNDNVQRFFAMMLESLFE